MHAQFLDPFCQRVRAEIDQDRPTAFKVDTTSGVLMRHVQEILQVVVPAALQKRLLTLAHRPQCEGPQGAQAVYQPSTGLLLARHGPGLRPDRVGLRQLRQ